MKYIFENKLVQGVIKSRPNRFIMVVDIGGNVFRCHCPSTGRIGNIEFKDVPCLLSKSENGERKTPFTVEAISLDKIDTKDERNKQSTKNKQWIGINQNKINKYVEYFLKNEQLPLLIKNGKTVEREKVLGKSRIDFKIGETFVEVKMPLIHMPSSEKDSKRKMSKFNSFDRTIRHFKELAEDIEKRGKDSRAILLMCYMYDAEPFVPPPIDRDNAKIHKAVRSAISKGVENWQVNLKIDEKGVELLRYFRLKLF
jgi:sugar fermentation stimulation protein A